MDDNIILYAYVLTSNKNFAPCINNGMWTLACCKPVIRYKAAEKLESGEYQVFVMGVAGKRLGSKYTPLYLAKVDRAISVKEYFDEKNYEYYKNRRDYVYMYNSTNDSWKTDEANNPHCSGCENASEELKERKWIPINLNEEGSSKYTKDLWYRGKPYNYVLVSDKHFITSDIPVIEELMKDIERSPRATHILNSSKIKEYGLELVIKEFCEKQKD